MILNDFSKIFTKSFFTLIIIMYKQRYVHILFKLILLP